MAALVGLKLKENQLFGDNRKTPHPTSRDDGAEIAASSIKHQSLLEAYASYILYLYAHRIVELNAQLR